MSIIIKKGDEKFIKLNKEDFEKEDKMQNYIHKNPESIPLYEIEEDLKLLVLCREFQTDSGPIDALGIDQHGNIYIIETKLHRNPDKRDIVAQVLDYGASLWMHSDKESFLENINTFLQKKLNVNFEQRLEQFYSDEEIDVESLKLNMFENLSGGNFRFVFVMDELHDKLKDLIIYINQNSKFNVYAVELEYYKHESFEILIPKIYGNEVKKDIAVNTTTSERRKWTEGELIETAKQNLSKEDFLAFEKVFNFSKTNGTEIRLGTGTAGSFSPIFGNIFDKSLFTLSTDGKLFFNFHWITKRNEKLAEDFKGKLDEIGFNLPEDYKESKLSVTLEEWLTKVDLFIEVLKNLTK